MHDVRNNSVLWRQTFAEGAPAHSLGLVPDQMVLAFGLKSDFAKERLDANPALAAQAQAITKRDTAACCRWWMSARARCCMSWRWMSAGL